MFNKSTVQPSQRYHDAPYISFWQYTKWPGKFCFCKSMTITFIISASLTINIIERKCSSYWSVAYPVCRSVCLSVCLSRKCTVAKQLIGSGFHLGVEWGWSRDECIRWGHRASSGRGDFWGLSPPLVWMAYFNRNVFNLCVESWQYFRTDNTSLEMFVYWLSKDIVSFEIKVGVYQKFAKM